MFSLMLKRKYAFFFVIYFLYTLSLAFIMPIFPLYMKSFVSFDAAVGIMVSVFSLMCMFFDFVMVKILKRLRKIHLAKISLGGIALCFAIMPFIESLWQFVILETIRTFFVTMSIFVFGLLLRDLVSKKNLGKIEGLGFSTMNLAYLIGPFTGGLIARHYNPDLVFIVSANFCAIVMLLLFIAKVKERVGNMRSEPILVNIKDYFMRKDLALIYLHSIGIAAWWILIYTFTPLFLKSIGMNEMFIGILLSLIIIPLLVFEIAVGFLADRHGYRIFLFLGFIIMAVFSMMAALVSSIYIFAALIILACIGASFVEPLREAYYFKAVPRADEARLYPVFRTAFQFGTMIMPLIYSGTLLLTGNNYPSLFIVASILMLLFAGSAWLMKSVRKVRKKKEKMIVPAEQNEKLKSK